MHLRLNELARVFIMAASILIASAASVRGQVPAIYDATPHGRVLACFGEAYALVELIDVATQNLSLLAVELQRAPDATRPALAAGLALSSTQIDHRQSLDVARRLVVCTERASGRATPDVGAAFTATAVREEIDAAIIMADGFTRDYQRLAARLVQFVSDSTEPVTKAVQAQPFSRVGDELRSALGRSRTAIDLVIERSNTLP